MTVLKRGKLHGLSLVALAATALLAAVPVKAAPVTDRTQMAAYIRQMTPLHAKIVNAENRLQRAQLGYIGGNVTDAKLDAVTRAFNEDIHAAYIGVKAIKPPDVLRGPHAAFVLTVKTEDVGSQQRLESTSRQMKTLRAQWRQEVTAQLRRAGLVVPLWVKTDRWIF
ncbi:hypothetical protein [Gaiella sp.]|uniref:hypothetical protein n=1 Tax=Gaiella sp. TaxID=2663207 RepID=UPI002E3115BE|nr:hypothetical protein [Gaiella sp.]